MNISPLSAFGLLVRVDPGPSSSQDATRQIVAAVRQANKSELLGANRELQFTRDNDTHRVIIQIKDAYTGETIDQIPSETVLRMLADLTRSAAEKPVTP